MKQQSKWRHNRVKTNARTMKKTYNLSDTKKVKKSKIARPQTINITIMN
jgi:hypothetical protein